MADPVRPDYPWAGWPDQIGCNFALGHLVNNLPALLTVDGRLHADTLICAAGAIAGWAAQRSLVARAPQGSPGSTTAHIVTTKDGRRFLYGDAINNMLVAPDASQASNCVWNCMAGTAISAGLAGSRLPSVTDMFAQVSRTLGSPLEGLPSLPENRPSAPVAVLLQRVRPFALSCLTGEIDRITKANGFAAAETSWQAVTAWMAASILAKCVSIMKPEAALTLGMESAIYASKLMDV